ncbi:glutathione S transferase E14 [Haematobia irritans]|uniref:glutathione S transferase E14 n=1 Tax=Haematobia irritans TaxID=7368 RepID=UPI003F50D10F
MKPVLYYDERSPPVRSVLMLIKILDIEVDLQSVDLFKREQMKPEFVEVKNSVRINEMINPAHTVPVLIDDDLILTDSHLILIHLCEKFQKDNCNLWPREYKDRMKIMNLLMFSCSIIFRRDSDVMSEIVRKTYANIDHDFHERKCCEAYEMVEKYLSRHKFLASENLTIADLSAVTPLSTLDLIFPIGTVNTSKWPLLANWMRHMKSLPEYQINQCGLDAFREKLEVYGNFICPPREEEEEIFQSMCKWEQITHNKTGEWHPPRFAALCSSFLIAFEEINKILNKYKQLQHCLYADDLYLYTTPKTKQQVQNIITSVTEDLSKWSTIYGSKISEQKCKHLHVCRKQKCSMGDFTIGNANFEDVSELRILGLHFNNGFNWGNEFADKTAKLASNSPTIMINNYTKKDLKNLIYPQLKQETHIGANAYYKSINPNFSKPIYPSQLSRQQQKVLIRLRLGQANSRTHHKKSATPRLPKLKLWRESRVSEKLESIPYLNFSKLIQSEKKLKNIFSLEMDAMYYLQPRNCCCVPPILHYDDLSPQARSCCMLINLLGINVDFRFEPGGELSENRNQIIPGGIDPILVDGKITLSDGHIIMMYLCDKYAGEHFPHLWPRDYFHRLELLNMLFYEAGVLNQLHKRLLMDILVNKSSNVQIEMHERKVQECYNILDAYLEGHTFLVGHCLTIADFSVITTLSSLDIIFPINPNEWPNLYRWFENLQRMECYKYNLEGIQRQSDILETIGGFPNPSTFSGDTNIPCSSNKGNNCQRNSKLLGNEVPFPTPEERRIREKTIEVQRKKAIPKLDVNGESQNTNDLNSSQPAATVEDISCYNKEFQDSNLTSEQHEMVSNSADEQRNEEDSVDHPQVQVKGFTARSSKVVVEGYRNNGQYDRHTRSTPYRMSKTYIDISPNTNTERGNLYVKSKDTKIIPDNKSEEIEDNTEKPTTSRSLRTSKEKSDAGPITNLEKFNGATNKIECQCREIYSESNEKYSNQNELDMECICMVIGNQKSDSSCSKDKKNDVNDEINRVSSNESNAEGCDNISVPNDSEKNHNENAVKDKFDFDQGQTKKDKVMESYNTSSVTVCLSDARKGKSVTICYGHSIVDYRNESRDTISNANNDDSSTNLNYRCSHQSENSVSQKETIDEEDKEDEEFSGDENGSDEDGSHDKNMEESNNNSESDISIEASAKSSKEYNFTQAEKLICRCKRTENSRLLNMDITETNVTEEPESLSDPNRFGLEKGKSVFKVDKSSEPSSLPITEENHKNSVTTCNCHKNDSMKKPKTMLNCIGLIVTKTEDFCPHNREDYEEEGGEKRNISWDVSSSNCRNAQSSSYKQTCCTEVSKTICLKSDRLLGDEEERSKAVTYRIPSLVCNNVQTSDQSNVLRTLNTPTILIESGKIRDVNCRESGNKDSSKGAEDKVGKSMVDCSNFTPMNSSWVIDNAKDNSMSRKHSTLEKTGVGIPIENMFQETENKDVSDMDQVCQPSKTSEIISTKVQRDSMLLDLESVNGKSLKNKNMRRSNCRKSLESSNESNGTKKGKTDKKLKGSSKTPKNLQLDGSKAEESQQNRARLSETSTKGKNSNQVESDLQIDYNEENYLNREESSNKNIKADDIKENGEDYENEENDGKIGNSLATKKRRESIHSTDVHNGKRKLNGNQDQTEQPSRGGGEEIEKNKRRCSKTPTTKILENPTQTIKNGNILKKSNQPQGIVSSNVIEESGNKITTEGRMRSSSDASAKYEEIDRFPMQEESPSKQIDKNRAENCEEEYRPISRPFIIKNDKEPATVTNTNGKEQSPEETMWSKECDKKQSKDCKEGLRDKPQNIFEDRQQTALRINQNKLEDFRSYGKPAIVIKIRQDNTGRQTNTCQRETPQHFAHLNQCTCREECNACRTTSRYNHSQIPCRIPRYIGNAEYGTYRHQNCNSSTPTYQYGDLQDNIPGCSPDINSRYIEDNCEDESLRRLRAGSSKSKHRLSDSGSEGNLESYEVGEQSDHLLDIQDSISICSDEKVKHINRIFDYHQRTFSHTPFQNPSFVRISQSEAYRDWNRNRRRSTNQCFELYDNVTGCSENIYSIHRQNNREERNSSRLRAGSSKRKCHLASWESGKSLLSQDSISICSEEKITRITRIFDYNHEDDDLIEYNQYIPIPLMRSSGYYNSQICPKHGKQVKNANSFQNSQIDIGKQRSRIPVLVSNFTKNLSYQKHLAKLSFNTNLSRPKDRSSKESNTRITYDANLITGSNTDKLQDNNETLQSSVERVETFNNTKIKADETRNNKSNYSLRSASSNRKTGLGEKCTKPEENDKVPIDHATLRRDSCLENKSSFKHKENSPENIKGEKTLDKGNLKNDANNNYRSSESTTQRESNSEWEDSFAERNIESKERKKKIESMQKFYNKNTNVVEDNPNTPNCSKNTEKQRNFLRRDLSRTKEPSKLKKEFSIKSPKLLTSNRSISTNVRKNKISTKRNFKSKTNGNSKSPSFSKKRSMQDNVFKSPPSQFKASCSMRRKNSVENRLTPITKSMDKNFTFDRIRGGLVNDNDESCKCLRTGGISKNLNEKIVRAMHIPSFLQNENERICEFKIHENLERKK